MREHFQRFASTWGEADRPSRTLWLLQAIPLGAPVLMIPRHGHRGSLASEFWDGLDSGASWVAPALAERHVVVASQRGRPSLYAGSEAARVAYEHDFLGEGRPELARSLHVAITEIQPSQHRDPKRPPTTRSSALDRYLAAGRQRLRAGGVWPWALTTANGELDPRRRWWTRPDLLEELENWARTEERRVATQGPIRYAIKQATTEPLKRATDRAIADTIRTAADRVL